MDKTMPPQISSLSRENEQEGAQQSAAENELFQDEENLPCGVDAKQCTKCILLQNVSPKASNQNPAMDTIQTQDAKTYYPGPGGTESSEIETNCHECPHAFNIQKHTDEQLPSFTDQKAQEEETHDGTTLHCYPNSNQQMCTEELRKCKVCNSGSQIPYAQQPIDDRVYVSQTDSHIQEQQDSTIICYPASEETECFEERRICDNCEIVSRTHVDSPTNLDESKIFTDVTDDTTNPDFHPVNTFLNSSQQQDSSYERKPICNACMQPLAQENQEIHSEQREKTFQNSRVSVSKSEQRFKENTDICQPEPGKKQCKEEANLCEDCTDVTPHANIEAGEQDIPMSTKEEDEITTPEITSQKTDVTPLELDAQQRAQDTDVLCAPTGDKECHSDSRLCVECSDITPVDDGQPKHEISTQHASEEPAAKTSDLDAHEPPEMISVLCARKGEEVVCHEDSRLCVVCTETTTAQEEQSAQEISTAPEGNAVTPLDLDTQQPAQDTSYLCVHKEEVCHGDSKLCVVCTEGAAQIEQRTLEISTQDVSEEPEVTTSELDAHRQLEMISVLCTRKGEEAVCHEDSRLCIVCTETTTAQKELSTEVITAADAPEETAATQLEVRTSELDAQQIREMIAGLCDSIGEETVSHEDSRLRVVGTEASTAQEEQPKEAITAKDAPQQTAVSSSEVATSELDAQQLREMIAGLSDSIGKETVSHEDSQLRVVGTETTIAQEEQPKEAITAEDAPGQTAVSPSEVTSELDAQQLREMIAGLCDSIGEETVCHEDSRLHVVGTETTAAREEQPTEEITTEGAPDKTPSEVMTSELDAHQPPEMISVLCARKGDAVVCHEDFRLCIVCTERTSAHDQQHTEQPSTVEFSKDVMITSKFEDSHREQISVLCTREPGKLTCNTEANICGECTKDLRQDELEINVQSDPSQSETGNPGESGHDETSQSGSKTFEPSTSETIQPPSIDDPDACHPSPDVPQCDLSKVECERCSSLKKPNNGSSMGPLRGGADFPDPFMNVSNEELDNSTSTHSDKKTYTFPLRGGADTSGPSIDDYSDTKMPSLCFCNSNVMGGTTVTNPPPPLQFLDEKHGELYYEPVKFESVTVSRGKEGKITTVASVRENQLKNMTDIEKEKLVLRDVILEIRNISAALDNLSSQLAIETVISLRPNEEIFYAIRHGNSKILFINVSDSDQVNVNSSEDTAVRNTMPQMQVRTLNDVSSFQSNSENKQERDKNCNPFQIEKVTINNVIQMNEIHTQVERCDCNGDNTNGKGHIEREVRIIAERMINNVTTVAQILCNLFFRKAGAIRSEITPSKVLCQRHSPVHEGECKTFECGYAKCRFKTEEHDSREIEKCDCDDVSREKLATLDDVKYNLEREVRMVAEKVVNNVTKLAQLIYSSVLRKGGTAIRSKVSEEQIKAERSWSEDHDHESTNVEDVRNAAQKLVDDVSKLSQLVYAVVHKYGEFTARTILNQQLPALTPNVEEIIQVPKNGDCKCNSILALNEVYKNTDKHDKPKSRGNYDNVEREVKLQAEEFVNNIITLAEILYRVLCKKRKYLTGGAESKEMPHQNLEWAEHNYADEDKNENIAQVKSAAENLVNNVTALAQLVCGLVYRNEQKFARTIKVKNPMIIEQVHECPEECTLMKYNTTPIKMQTTAINEGRITQTPVEKEICECNEILSIETDVKNNECLKESYDRNEICCVAVHANDKKNVTMEAEKLVNNVITLSQKLYRVLYEKGTSIIRRPDSNETVTNSDRKWAEIHYSGEKNTSDHDRFYDDIKIVAKKLIDNVMTLAQMIYRTMHEKKKRFAIKQSPTEEIPEDNSFTQLTTTTVSNGENNQNMVVDIPEKLFQKETLQCECRHKKQVKSK